MKTITEKYYCPLTFSMNYRFNGEWEDDSNEFENEKALEYLPQIAEFVENNDGGEMMDCFVDCGIEKLKDIRWSVEVVDGVLYGCIIATLSEPLTPTEDTKLKQKISGQNSDGFGECLAQSPLRVEAGEIYISFYNSGNKYFVLNKEEFSYYLGKKNPPTEESRVATKKRCPKCGAESFYVTAHVCQEWKVDCNGTFIETIEECSQVLHQPDDDDIWTCADCGYDATGSKFNVRFTKQPQKLSRKRMLCILGLAMIAYSSELEEMLDCANGTDTVDELVYKNLTKDFGMTKEESSMPLISIPSNRLFEIIDTAIPAYESILETQDYESEEDLHKVVLNEFGMTEEEYRFFKEK